MSGQPEQIREIFLEAVAINSPDARAAYVDEACGEDAEMRRRVESLIVAHERPESLLDKAALEGNGSPIETAAMPPVGERQGGQIGPYKLLEQIGEGGFGVVYLAEQEEPIRRYVALKVIKPGMDTRQVIARFEAERQALALMDHPSIAHVLDAGASGSGRPFFVMELVKGIPITDYCDQCNLTTDERLRLFIDVCHAVQHAHQKGIIHRDLKPTNVLVAMQDGEPTVKVIDFGVAKAINQRLTEQTLMTGIMQMVGTPLYMSPEQAEMGPLDVDTRSDVYSLGVLLYELLTGTTPFERERLKDASYDELRRIIREVDPPRPSTRLSTLNAAAISTAAEHRRTDSRRLRQQIRGDLDWIVMKALDKDRARRYETANEFADDVERYLAHQPVEACPPSAAYRLSKFALRNRFALAMASIVGALLLVATVVSAWQAVRATKAETLAQGRLKTQTRALASESKALGEAEQAALLAKRQETLALKQRDLTLQNLYVAQVRLAHQDWKAGHLTRMRTILDALLPRDDLPDLRSWEWYYLASLLNRQSNVFDPKIGPVRKVDVSPDGRLVAIGGAQGAIIYEPVSQQIVHSFPGHTRAVWSPDGSQLATIAPEREAATVEIWDTENWQQTRTMESWQRTSLLAWKPDNRGLAWVADGSFAFWVADRDEPLPMQHPASSVFGILTATWSPDGRLLLLAGAFPSLTVFWDTVENKAALQIDTENRGTTHIAISPDGKRFAAAGVDGDIALRNLHDGALIHQFGAHNGHVSVCVWSPDGKRLASGGDDNLVRVWDAETGHPLNRFSGHRSVVSSLDWSKDDQLISGSHDGTVRFWRPDEKQDALLIYGRGSVGWSPDGRIITNGPYEEGKPLYTVCDPRSGKVLQTLHKTEHGSMHVYAWSPNGKMVAGASFHGSAVVWDASTGRVLHSLPRAHIEEGADHGETRCVAWSPDNRQFATCGMDSLVKVWETSSAKLLRTLDEHSAPLGSVCWSPDGRWFASADWGRDVKIRAADTWQIEWEIDGQPALIGGAGGNYTIAWSPDSQRLAAVNASGQIVVWKLLPNKQLEKVWAADAHTSVIRGIAWSPDGSRIASANEDRTAKVFSAPTGRELLTLEGHSTMVKAVAWSPDSRCLISASDRMLHVWDATEAYEKLSGPEAAQRLSSSQTFDSATDAITAPSDNQ